MQKSKIQDMEESKEKELWLQSSKDSTALAGQDPGFWSSLPECLRVFNHRQFNANVQPILTAGASTVFTTRLLSGSLLLFGHLFPLILYSGLPSGLVLKEGCGKSLSGRWRVYVLISEAEENPGLHFLGEYPKYWVVGPLSPPPQVEFYVLSGTPCNQELDHNRDYVANLDNFSTCMAAKIQAPKNLQAKNKASDESSCIIVFVVSGLGSI